MKLKYNPVGLFISFVSISISAFGLSILLVTNAHTPWWMPFAGIATLLIFLLQALLIPAANEDRVWREFPLRLRHLSSNFGQRQYFSLPMKDVIVSGSFGFTLQGGVSLGRSICPLFFRN